MLRRLRPEDLEGKTIKEGGVQILGVNSAVLHFTDGSQLEIWAEDYVFTQFGNISGLLIIDENGESEKEDVHPS